jgi:phosphopantothenoylcysteine decarboxylase/phosphopantothenate--cysteine ligase
MYDAVMSHLEEDCIFIGAAAVADYQIESPATEKMKKKDHPELTLKLTRAKDILTAVAESGKAAFVVGFAAETSNLIAYASDKLKRKKLDMVVANQVGKGIGFDSVVNKVSIITKNSHIDLDLTHKTRLAGQIIAILASTLQNTAH